MADLTEETAQHLAAAIRELARQVERLANSNSGVVTSQVQHYHSHTEVPYRPPGAGGGYGGGLG